MQIIVHLLDLFKKPDASLNYFPDSEANEEAFELIKDKVYRELYNQKVVQYVNNLKLKKGLKSSQSGRKPRGK